MKDTRVKSYLEIADFVITSYHSRLRVFVKYVSIFFMAVKFIHY